jgi:hypothetical protein
MQTWLRSLSQTKWGLIALAVLLIGTWVHPTNAQAQDGASTLSVQAWDCPLDTPDEALFEACVTPLPDLLVGTPGMDTSGFPGTDTSGGLVTSIPSEETVLLRIRWPYNPELDGVHNYQPVFTCDSSSGAVSVVKPDTGYDGILIELWTYRQMTP